MVIVKPNAIARIGIKINDSIHRTQLRSGKGASLRHPSIRKKVAARPALQAIAPHAALQNIVAAPANQDIISLHSRVTDRGYLTLPIDWLCDRPEAYASRKASREGHQEETDLI